MRPRVTVHVVMSLDGKVLPQDHSGDPHSQATDWEELQECRISADMSVSHELEITEAIKVIGASGVKHVHCEGGSALLAQLFSDDLVDELFLTWAGSKVIGGIIPTMSSECFLPQSRQMELLSMEAGSAGECYLHYRRVDQR